MFFGLFKEPVPESARRLYALNRSPCVAVIETRRVRALKSYPTSKCYNNFWTPSIAFVAADLYDGLPSIQPETTRCDVGALLVYEGYTYDILSLLPGIDSSIRCSKEMGEALIEQGYVLTLRQFDELSFVQAFGKSINRYVCFVQTTDPEQPVAVICLWLFRNGSYVERRNLERFRLNRWDALLLPNPVV